MKRNFAFFCVFCLAACSADIDEAPLDVQTPAAVPSLTEKVQKTVTAEQAVFLAALPEKIDTLNAVGAVADYEKNKRGGGFSRTYENQGATLSLTVFVYNGYDFCVNGEISEKTRAAMDEALKKFQIFQENGQYKNVKADPVAEKEMKVRGHVYPFLRATVSFTVKGEKKTSYVALIPCRPLMSYIRLQLTYPNSFAATRLQNTALRAVMSAAAELPDDPKPAAGFY